MKKLMVLVLLAGGVSLLRADHSKLVVLKSVTNVTQFPITYHAPDGSTHAIAPRTTTHLDIALHDRPRIEARSKSYFTSPHHAVALQFAYQKAVAYHRDPALQDWRQGELLERITLSLSYLVSGTGGEPHREIPLYEYYPGPIRFLVTTKIKDRQVHVTFEGDEFERSSISMEHVPATPFSPRLDLVCARSLTGSPLGGDSPSPGASPR